MKQTYQNKTSLLVTGCIGKSQENLEKSEQLSKWHDQKQRDFDPFLLKGTQRQFEFQERSFLSQNSENFKIKLHKIPINQWHSFKEENKQSDSSSKAAEDWKHKNKEKNKQKIKISIKEDYMDTQQAYSTAIRKYEDAFLMLVFVCILLIGYALKCF